MLVHNTVWGGNTCLLSQMVCTTSLATVQKATGRRKMSEDTIMLGTVMWATVVEGRKRDRLK